MRQRADGEARQRARDQEEDEEKLHAEAEAKPNYWRGESQSSRASEREIDSRSSVRSPPFSL